MPNISSSGGNGQDYFGFRQTDICPFDNFWVQFADPQAILFTNALGLGNALCFLDSCGYGRELVSINGHYWA